MHNTCQLCATPRAVALLFGVALLAGIGVPRIARAEQDNDSERVPSSAGEIYSPIQRTFERQSTLPGGPRPRPGAEEHDGSPVLFQDLKQRLQYADPFWRDMKIGLYARTHELTRNNAEGPPSKAWAAGTALAIATGFHDGWLQFEAAGATSQPLYAPAGEGGTLLLTDNQAEISSFAIANARLRGFGQDLIIGRQLIKTPYLNPQDNRMIPNSFEGVALMRERDETQKFDYGAAYLWGFKARDSSHFEPFSHAYGVEQDRGIFVAGAKASPIKGMTVGAIDYLMPDVVNTAFLEFDWIIDTAPVQLRFSTNYTHQQAVGADLAGHGSTFQISERFAASYEKATFLVAASHNGDGGPLTSPFGSFPAYSTLDQLNFNAAGQQSVVIGLAYDFSELLLEGLKAQTRYGWSWGAIDAQVGSGSARQNEFNIELEYAPHAGLLENFLLQAFYSAVEFPNAPPGETQQPQVRAVITYLVPLL